MFDLENVKSIVNVFKNRNNVYEILNVPRSCKNDELLKSIKMFHIKLHPDKNRCHRATDAFDHMESFRKNILNDAECNKNTNFNNNNN